MLCLIFFDLFVLFLAMHFKPQKFDIILKRIHHHLSFASTIRYRRAEVPAKVLLSIDIFLRQMKTAALQFIFYMFKFLLFEHTFLRFKILIPV
jgi:hypothetical protein